MKRTLCQINKTNLLKCSEKKENIEAINFRGGDFGYKEVNLIKYYFRSIKNH